eukprot:ctg_3592.g715
MSTVGSAFPGAKKARAPPTARHLSHGWSSDEEDEEDESQRFLSISFCSSNGEAVDDAVDGTPARKPGTRPYARPSPVRTSAGVVERVTPAQVLQWMSGPFPHSRRRLLLVDCRYPYEYEAGHVRGAINAYTPEQAYAHLFPDMTAAAADTDAPPSPCDTVIFYCEYSSQRAPKMYQAVRSLDRELHLHRYPYLQYPRLLVMEGGYRAAYRQFGTALCDGQYRRMCEDTAMRDGARLWGRARRSSSFARSGRLAWLGRLPEPHTPRSLSAPGGLALPQRRRLDLESLTDAPAGAKRLLFDPPGE